MEFYFFLSKLYSYGGELRYVLGYSVIEDEGVPNDAAGVILEVIYMVILHIKNNNNFIAINSICYVQNLFLS